MKNIFLLAVTISLHSNVLTNAAALTDSARLSNSSTDGGGPATQGNPCFLQSSSAACVAYIADKRGVSYPQARSLIARAVRLYAIGPTTAPYSAPYELSAVAVACLASPSTLRPGPDGDCVACADRCYEEVKSEVCELYCTITLSEERDHSTIGKKDAAFTERSRSAFPRIRALVGGPGNASSKSNGAVPWKEIGWVAVYAVAIFILVAACSGFACAFKSKGGKSPVSEYNYISRS